MDENEFILQLGKNIQRIRKEKSITQADLSLSTGIEESNISRLEAGRTNPTTTTLFIIAEQLGVKVQDFFEFEKLSQ